MFYMATRTRTHKKETLFSRRTSFYLSHSICFLHHTHILDIDIDWEKIFVVKFRCTRTLVRRRIEYSQKCAMYFACLATFWICDSHEIEADSSRMCVQQHVPRIVWPANSPACIENWRENTLSPSTKDQTKSMFIRFFFFYSFLFFHFIIELGSFAGQSVESCCNMSKYV